MGTVQDNALVYRTIQKAKKEVADGLILYSDQGFQYTSRGYLNLTKQYGILPSMSRAATPLDNAPAENFFGILKTKCIYRHKIDSIEHAQQLVHDYIYYTALAGVVVGDSVIFVFDSFPCAVCGSGYG